MQSVTIYIKRDRQISGGREVRQEQCRDIRKESVQGDGKMALEFYFGDKLSKRKMKCSMT